MTKSKEDLIKVFLIAISFSTNDLSKKDDKYD